VATERPVELLEPLKEVRAPEHGKATLSCKLSKPNKKVAWFKNGVELSPTEAPRYTIVSEDCEYTVTIDDCQLDDTAKYSMRCHDIETSATLTVDGMCNHGCRSRGHEGSSRPRIKSGDANALSP